MPLTLQWGFSFRDWSLGLPNYAPHNKGKRQDSSCVPGTQTTTTGDVFTVVCGVDFPGNDMSQTPEVSISACLEACADSHPLCIGVAFEATRAHGPNNCYLKSAAGAAVTQTFSMDGAYSAPTPESNACVGEVSPYVAGDGELFALSCGLDYPGGDMVQQHSDSLNDCIEDCANYGTGCVGVAYEASLLHGWLNCYLKSLILQPSQQAFVVHGAKLIGTSTSTPSSSATSSVLVPLTSSLSTTTSSSSVGSTTQTPFAATPAPSQSQISLSRGSNHNGLKLGLGIGISFGVLLFAILGIAILWNRRRRNRGVGEAVYPPADIAGAEKVEKPVGAEGAQHGFGHTFYGNTETGAMGTVSPGWEEQAARFGDPAFRAKPADGGTNTGRGAGSRTTRRGELEGEENQVHELPGQYGSHRGYN